MKKSVFSVVSLSCQVVCQELCVNPIFSGFKTKKLLFWGGKLCPFLPLPLVYMHAITWNTAKLHQKTQQTADETKPKDRTEKPPLPGGFDSYLVGLHEYQSCEEYATSVCFLYPQNTVLLNLSLMKLMHIFKKKNNTETKLPWMNLIISSSMKLSRLHYD